jgi:hypothetical protein
MDEWLAERCGMYTEWLDVGRIAYSSRVIPVGKSLPDRQWVLLSTFPEFSRDNQHSQSHHLPDLISYR